MNDRWEYRTVFLWPNMEDRGAKEALKAVWSEGVKPFKYRVEAMIPQLNEWGADGWELVHMQPVFVGRNHDVQVNAGEGTWWSNAYFCAFKRPLTS